MGHWGLGLWQKMNLRMGQSGFDISDCGGINYCYVMAIKISHQDKWFRELFY